jgi:hypothetical protein
MLKNGTIRKYKRNARISVRDAEGNVLMKSPFVVVDSDQYLRPGHVKPGLFRIDPNVRRLQRVTYHGKPPHKPSRIDWLAVARANSDKQFEAEASFRMQEALKRALARK